MAGVCVWYLKLMIFHAPIGFLKGGEMGFPLYSAPYP